MSEEIIEEKSFFQIIVHSFFVIPFLIAVFCVLLFAGVHLLTRENRTVYDYLEDVKTGGLTKRWQGAFELSKILANPKLLPEEDRFYNELINAFSDSKHDDQRVRQYLALAMGRTGRLEFSQPLLDALPNAKDATLTTIIYSLGMLQDEKAINDLSVYITHPEARIRSLTAVALGNIGSSSSIKVLEGALNDTEPNVQWGAAISLAKLGSVKGEEIIAQLLSRKYLESFEHIDHDEQNNLIIAAIDAANQLNNENLNNIIRELSRTDPNMKVRSESMKYFEN